MLEFAHRSLKNLFDLLTWWQLSLLFLLAVVAVLKQKVGQYLSIIFFCVYLWVVWDYGRQSLSDSFQPAAFGLLVGVGVFVGLVGFYMLFLRSEF